jgi:hypothetical protein
MEFSQLLSNPLISLSIGATIGSLLPTAFKSLSTLATTLLQTKVIPVETVTKAFDALDQGLRTYAGEGNPVSTSEIYCAARVVAQNISDRQLTDSELKSWTAYLAKKFDGNAMLSKKLPATLSPIAGQVLKALQ